MGVIIFVAVMLFHAHHIRREFCSSTRKERFRRLKRKYQDRERMEKDNTVGDQDHHRQSTENGMEEQEYGHVIDVNL